MAKGIFVVGTDTDVGKTIVTAGLLHVLRSKGHRATYFKGALSGAIEEGDKLIPGDTDLVSKVSGLKEPYENITPYIFKTAISPHLASKIEDNPIDLNIIKAKYEELKEKYDFIIAEGSGGIICPLINSDEEIYTLGDLIKDLNMSTVVVARGGVGTINHSVLTVKYMDTIGIKVKGIIINNYEDNYITKDNIKVIEKLTGVPVVGKFKTIDKSNIDNIRTCALNTFNDRSIIDWMEEL
jgi:dethiobiotin synthetase